MNEDASHVLSAGDPHGQARRTISARWAITGESPERELRAKADMAQHAVKSRGKKGGMTTPTKLERNGAFDRLLQRLIMAF